MWKKRLGYGLLMALLAVLLFVFSKPFLLGARGNIRCRSCPAPVRRSCWSRIRG